MSQGGVACMAKGGMCGEGGMHGREGVHGRGHAWQGACMVVVGRVYGRGHVWQETRPLQRMVCILLECILDEHVNELCQPHFRYPVKWRICTDKF